MATGAGTAAAEHLQTGARIARYASQRWRIPVQVVTTGRDDATAWRREMLAAGERALLER